MDMDTDHPHSITPQEAILGDGEHANPDADADYDGAPDSRINHTAAKAYWGSVNADVNGMLGGFPQVSRVDLQGSRTFLARLGITSKSGPNGASAAAVGNGIGSNGAGKRKLRSSDTFDGDGGEKVEEAENGDEKVAPEVEDQRIKRVVDCGAGIGRITTGLLLSIAQNVDIVEPIKKFTDALKDRAGVGRVFNVGLEEWDPSSSSSATTTDEKDKEGWKYDMIWNQWCLGHLTDEQLEAYLRRCAVGLVPGGIIVVKENIAIGGRDMFDAIDNSVTRTDDKFREIFINAGLKMKRTELQRGFPNHLFPVRMYALVPDQETKS